MEQTYSKDPFFIERKFVAGKVLSGRVYPEFFPCVATDSVLNIGCGFGPQAVVYRNRYARMVGIDVNAERLHFSTSLLSTEYGVRNYETICASVESVPLPSESFDKAIAVDIAEHVQFPDRMIREACRLLKPEGLLLVTFSTGYNWYAWIGGIFSRTSFILKDGWHPDCHSHDFSVVEWIALVEREGLTFVRSRATTMFPPLHLYGIPRFWFSNDCIHAVDRFFCSIPFLKNWGQTLMCVFKK